MQKYLKYIKEELNLYYPETEISAFARLLLSHICKLPYSTIMTEQDLKLNSTQKSELDAAISRLKNYEPIQYILEETEFFGLPFYVNKNVLIPRPETEELLELIINENLQEGLSVLDIGTGSGCIAISLARYLRKADISAWEISPLALEVAILNSKKNNVNINFKKTDVLGEYPSDKRFDIIVSNPPYILEKEKQDMDTNVLDYEPHTALFVPDDKSLIFYERIADIALQILKPNGKLYFEINRAKGQETIDMLKKKGFLNIELHKDLSGNDRMVRAEIVKQ